jgi:hypothetical protein
MGYEDRNEAGVPPLVAFDRRPGPPHSKMIDNNNVPMPRQVHLESAPKRQRIVLARYIRKAAEKTSNRKMPAYLSFPLG